jgi:Ca2+-binding RTX toxin-like protein
MIMATITVTAAFAGKALNYLFDETTFRLRVSHGGEMILADGDGASVEIHGSGFKYSHGEATDGIITSATIRDEDGNLLLRMRHGHVEASQVFAELDKAGIFALNWTFAAGDDHVIGSKKGDNLDGDYGDDVVNGKAGDDFLSGYHGNDVLIGGAGSDNFMFTNDFGVDTVRDFDDSGQDQDVIRLQFKRLYNHMDMHQDGADVVLDFGHGDELIIENAKAAHITREDFVFG